VNNRNIYLPTNVGEGEKFTGVLIGFYNSPTAAYAFMPDTGGARLSRQFAYDNKLAVVGHNGKPVDSIESWRNDAAHAALFQRAYQPYLRTIAQQTNHPELETAGIIWTGCSGEGSHAQAMGYGTPERTIAIVSYHGRSPYLT